MTEYLLAATVLFLAYANGANDNFKGVATLFGSNTTGFAGALTLGTLATLAGSISSVFFADVLIQTFSGKGLVPPSVAASTEFILAVGVGAAATVMLATVLGLPISTTHSIIGGLLGAGLMTSGGEVNFFVLISVFLLPLLTSPLISLLLAAASYGAAHLLADKVGVRRESCVCLAPGKFVAVQGGPNFSATGDWQITSGTEQVCVTKYGGQLVGITLQRAIDGIHYASAAAVSFARGLNDTPKLVGLLLVLHSLEVDVNLFAIALAMAVGGLINARAVAYTISKKITAMNDGQAVTANLSTALLVITASLFGLPVSTTHVSVGAIMGIGLVNGSANPGPIANILLSWLLTLPIAGAIAAGSTLLIHGFL
jgi:inorganic phosphate transporter, PiT family